MNFNIKKLTPLLFVSLFIADMPVAKAICYKVHGIGKLTSNIPLEVAALGYTAKSWGGVLNEAAASISFGTVSVGIGAGLLSPAGTIIASAHLPFIETALKVPYSANQILFKCALTDADDLYEIYSLPGGTGQFYGGKAVTDVEGAYQTPAAGIAYRITNLKTGLYYTGYWQERKLTSDDYIVVGSNLYIPATAFSSATFELIKTDDSFGLTTRNAFGQIITPQGYETLRTPTLNASCKTGMLALPPNNVDHTTAVWSMRRGTTTVIHGNTCKLADFDQVVNLPAISAGDLMDGLSSSNTFNVAIDCEKGAVSGTTSNNKNPPVAIGFLVSQAPALSQASTLGLQTSAGGIRYLLDDHYGASGVASGVGIRIYSSEGGALNLLSSGSTTGTGPDAGWYGFADLMSETGSSTSATSYAGTFTAALEQLPGLIAQAGSVNAQAQIIVSLQ